MTNLKQLKQKVFIGAVAIATAGLASSAYAQVTVFQDINFQGEGTTFNGDMPNLTQNGWNDRISSIRIPDGESWQVCVDANYGNRCEVLTSSVADLRTMGLNDAISSIRRMGGRYGYRNRTFGGPVGTSGVSTGARVFTGPNFRGQSGVINGTASDLREYNLNDRVRSIEIPSGETWEVCHDINFGGGCQTVTGNVTDLRSMGLGDISSMRPVSRNYRNNRRYNDGTYNNGVYNNGNYNNQQGLVIFNRSGFQGGSQFVPIGGSTNPGFAANRGSLQVRGGTWEVCDDQGDCRRVSSDVSDMSQLGLRGRITSVRSVSGNVFRRFIPR